MSLEMDLTMQPNNKREFKLLMALEVELMEWDISRIMNLTHYQGSTQDMDHVAKVKEVLDIKR